MKAVVGKLARKYRFVFVVVGFLSIFSFEVWASSDWLSQKQNCSNNCEIPETLAASNPTAESNTRIAAAVPTERTGGSQPMHLSNGNDLRAMTPASTWSRPDQGSIDTQANKSPASDGASTPGASFFLILGLALIGIRLVISYRSRKLKNLAAQTD